MMFRGLTAAKDTAVHWKNIGLCVNYK